jgi:16S rRNA processing protein RimM
MPPSAGDERAEYLIVARSRRPHGLRGELLVTMDTDRPKQVFRRGRALQVGDGEGDPTGRVLVLEAMRPTPDGAILRFEGLTAREEADALRGTVLMIPADEAEPAGQDEVHYRDLIGLAAVAAGVRLGAIEDILEIGTTEMLVVRGEGNEEILIPFVKEIVRGVDLDRQELRLELPEGFLEI